MRVVDVGGGCALAEGSRADLRWPAAVVGVVEVCGLADQPGVQRPAADFRRKTWLPAISALAWTFSTASAPGASEAIGWKIDLARPQAAGGASAAVGSMPREK